MSLSTDQYHTYRVFGLTLVSDLAFPELFSANGSGDTPDVTVKLGKVPAKESVTGRQKPYTAFNGQEFWYHVPDIAMYYVSNGNEITIEPVGGRIDETRLFFLSTVLSAMLYQRDLMPLHASGVVDETGGVYLFTAPSRTGKSTTLYLLSQMGYRPFTDDVCVLRPGDESGTSFFASAGFPLMKLWDETIKKVATDQDAAKSRRLRPQVDKYGMGFHDLFSDRPVRVKGIIVLKADRTATEIEIERLSPMAAFKALEHNVYSRHWVEPMGKVMNHFRDISRWSNQLPVYLAQRPLDVNTLETFAAAIQREILLPGL